LAIDVDGKDDGSDLVVMPVASHHTTPPAQPAAKPASSRTARLTAQQVEARRAMAATLTGSISSVIKEEEQKDSARVKHGSTRRMPTVGDDKKKRGPAVLTGEGEQEARNLRQWLIGTAVFVLLIVGLGWLIIHRSPERRAIDDFVLITPAQIRANNGDRISALQSNAWLTTLPSGTLSLAALVDPGPVTFGPDRTLDPTLLRTATDLITGLEALDDDSGWSTPVPATPSTDAKPAGKPRTVLRKDLEASLTKANANQDDVLVILALLLGRDHAGARPFGDAISKGRFPTAITLKPFTSKQGTVLLRGQTRGFDTGYRGLLMQVTGAGWPDGWKVLSIAIAKDA
jgi:hypothetical protein